MNKCPRPEVVPPFLVRLKQSIKTSGGGCFELVESRGNNVLFAVETCRTGYQNCKRALARLGSQTCLGDIRNFRFGPAPNDTNRNRGTALVITFFKYLGKNYFAVSDVQLRGGGMMFRFDD